MAYFILHFILAIGLGSCCLLMIRGLFPKAHPYMGVFAGIAVIVIWMAIVFLAYGD